MLPNALAFLGIRNSSSLDYEHFYRYLLYLHAKLSLLLLDDNSPWMLDLTVHNIIQPLLDQSSVVAAITLRHRDLNLAVLEVDCRNRGDEVLRHVSDEQEPKISNVQPFQLRKLQQDGLPSRLPQPPAY